MIILFPIILAFGIGIHFFAAWNFQSRAWIDELWVVLNPAYKLVFGIGKLIPEFDLHMRSFLPISLVALLLKFFKTIGLNDGPTVLAILRILTTTFVLASTVFFCIKLGRFLKLKRPTLLGLGLGLLIPELINYSHFAELSVLGAPFLLVGLALSPPLSNRFRTLGFSLLVFSGLIRYQYCVIPFCFLFYFLYRREFKIAREVFMVGFFGIVFDVIFNSLFYGKPCFPIFQYFYVNLVGGMAASFGTSPFYLGIEMFWRFVTEPVFVLIIFLTPFGLKKFPLHYGSALFLLLIHLFIGHKEYRFFYGPALLLSILSGAAFESWLHENWKPHKRKTTFCLHGFLSLFTIFSFYRAEKKIDWHAFETPSRLETFAGTMRDLNGLLVYGWGGIYSGANFTLYRPLPYVSAETRDQLLQRIKQEGYEPKMFNYVISPENDPPPCGARVNQFQGGALYRCRLDEITAMMKSN